MRVNIGTAPQIDTYNIPMALLRYHSVYFDEEIVRLKSVQKDSQVNKKRKLSEEPAIKMEEEEDTGHMDASHANSIQKDDPSIDIQWLQPKIFELFIKFVYMGSYSSEVDGNQAITHHPVAPPGTFATPHISPQVALSAQAPNAQSNVSSTATSTNDRVQLPFPPPKASMARPPTVSTAPQHIIPSSVRAWLLGANIGAAHFMNHAMCHLHSGLGKKFSLTPYLVHYIWQRTPPISALRGFINHVLVAHWAEDDQSRPCIDRHPALDTFWMQLFHEYADLKALILLGVREKRYLMPCEAYFVQPQMQVPAAVAVAKEAQVVVEAISKDAEQGSNEKGEVEVQEVVQGSKVEVSDGKSKKSDVAEPAAIDIEAME